MFISYINSSLSTISISLFHWFDVDDLFQFRHFPVILLKLVVGTPSLEHGLFHKCFQSPHPGDFIKSYFASKACGLYQYQFTIPVKNMWNEKKN